jgi:hypothetical protein
LSLSDLSFGFVIWLVTCAVAVVVFIGEIVTKFIEKFEKPKKLVKVKFAKVHPLESPLKIHMQLQPTPKARAYSKHTSCLKPFRCFVAQN